jgi:uncharacterized membrane protein YhaH (DUF805 family)
MFRFLFSPSGRSGRTEYILYSISVYIFSQLAGRGLQAAGDTLPEGGMLFLTATLLIIVLVLVVSGLILTIRRFHDLNQSGWYVLILIVPLVNLYYLLKLSFFEGNDDHNEYGRAPQVELPLIYIIALWITFVFGAAYIEKQFPMEKGKFRMGKMMTRTDVEPAPETPQETSGTAATPPAGAPVMSEREKQAQQLRNRAELGEPEAEYDLAYRYLSGDGVPADPSQTAVWLRRAAYHGLAKAQYNLGILHATGQGVTKDDNEAYFWLTVALKSGYALPAGEKDYRAVVAARLSPEALAAADKRVASWLTGK